MNFCKARFGDLILQECQSNMVLRSFGILTISWKIVGIKFSHQLLIWSVSFLFGVSCWTTGCLLGWYLRRWILVWQAWQGQEPWMKTRYSVYTLYTHTIFIWLYVYKFLSVYIYTNRFLLIRSFVCFLFVSLFSCCLIDLLDFTYLFTYLFIWFMCIYFVMDSCIYYVLIHSYPMCCFMFSYDMQQYTPCCICFRVGHKSIRSTVLPSQLLIYPLLRFFFTNLIQTIEVDFHLAMLAYCPSNCQKWISDWTVIFAQWSCRHDDNPDIKKSASDGGCTTIPP